uniref:Orf176 n=1 Tax=Porphyra purpurea TaxID=2787 RepID=O99989_PORPU|nr:orf176 [Porphyra purpurea]AAD03117.1 orf176 [Porphyra purpurea]
MRSRILNCKKTLVDYDILTQFPINRTKELPDFNFYEVQLKNVSCNDVKNICLNLVATQLIGNSSTTNTLYLPTTELKLRVTDKTKYFLIENIFLLSYKNLVKNFNSFGRNKSKSFSTISFSNFSRVVEYSSVHSNLMKSMEKETDKNSIIKIAYKISSSNKKSINLYFLKSLGYPF